MNTVFADSFYFFALLNNTDAAHERAMAFGKEFRGRLVTTDWIITELGDGLAKSPRRDVFGPFVRDLENHPRVTVVPSSRSLMNEGIDLYERRSDKSWSLTDCISFVVMQQEGITDVLTGDHHFEQAGFKALLK